MMNKHQNDRSPDMLDGEPDAEDLRAVWCALGHASSSQGPSAERTDSAWNSLSERLGLTMSGGRDVAPELEDRAPADRTAGRRTVLAIHAGSWLRAAAMLVLLSVGASVWHTLPVSHTAPEGGRFSVVLPDGSEATLNAGSEIRYRRNFSWIPGVPQGRRTVRLEGEAFFDVTAGDRLFEVLTGSARVTVVGTRFNVRARSGAAGVSGVRVDVEEGHVVVAVEGTKAVARIGAGEGVRFARDAPTLVPEAVSPARIGSWRTGGLTLTDEPLAAVVAEFGVRFGTDVSLADSVDGSRRVSAYYPLLTSIELSLGDLATQQNLRVRRTADGWELF